MGKIDFSDFWDNSDYALKEYVNEVPSDELIKSVEQELGYRLPADYVGMMKVQNGGVPKNTCFPTKEPTSWAEDHVAITGIFGIGRDKAYALCGQLGSQFMIDEWGYPDIGVCICDCPSAGHDMIMLDYRRNGKDGVPEVIHVDQESDYKITFLAKDFGTFVKGLVSEEVYDTSEEDLKITLEALETGDYSDFLQGFLDKETEPGLGERLRRLLIELTHEKGYFALHADALSYLVYDLQFYLYVKNKPVRAQEEYLAAYPQMIAFGNREISTHGYAPDFVKEWMEKRLSEGRIQKGDSGELSFQKEYEAQVLEEIKKYG